ncbi:NADH-ubiquinone oxidoreductase 21kDa subunit [Sparassis latifolia]|uniref:NADH dehydrogenase [ubiquinone] iron-sulfur protein 4, mitochondrial n=1 Tax=Sparassis crispa TaxID=139825 RepID=A0A401GS35_9APHY|nr:NADH-ubiquinone oxidoreductase 21 kDa subunit, mitochondrial [Sparassis crispa]GBE85038.1 NADH-ubiquinone oxidoreductase 21 kDa subunit, mitochondrial [Sparassis crispa]
MFALRLCQGAVSQRAVGRTLYVSSRALNTHQTSTPAETREKQRSEVTTAPERDVVTADIISGAPGELRHRAVRIFQPTRSTTQSGSGKSHRWRIDWDVLQGAGRWENPLMGWASSADYMQGTRISFRSKEDAIHFAEKQGWDYYVQQPEVKRIPPKNYAENYLYRPNKLRIMRTK